MLSLSAFFNTLKENGIDFFTGVPDSLLKSFNAYVCDHCVPEKHVLAANEGNAIGLAAGYHLATAKTGAVYMQNSGLGNCINPLTSLTDASVYRIPVLLIIGWRGEPGVKDEPQHIKQGLITPAQLELIGIPFWVLSSDSDFKQDLFKAISELKKRNSPVALLIRKGAFEEYPNTNVKAVHSSMKREDALRLLLDLLTPEDLIISTTGKTSRELFELRRSRGEDPRDFLMVGSMGHASSIAMGAALGRPDRRVVCLDGDGAMIMHLGALPIIGFNHLKKFIHILLNNASHESVGGQSTCADKMDFEAISLACGYQNYFLAESTDTMRAAWPMISDAAGPIFFEICICTGSRKDLGRPIDSAEQNKKKFMDSAHGEETGGHHVALL